MGRWRKDLRGLATSSSSVVDGASSRSHSRKSCGLTGPALPFPLDDSESVGQEEAVKRESSGGLVDGTAVKSDAGRPLKVLGAEGPIEARAFLAASRAWRPRRVSRGSGGTRPKAIPNINI